MVFQTIHIIDLKARQAKPITKIIKKKQVTLKQLKRIQSFLTDNPTQDDRYYKSEEDRIKYQ